MDGTIHRSKNWRLEENKDYIRKSLDFMEEELT